MILCSLEYSKDGVGFFFPFVRQTLCCCQGSLAGYQGIVKALLNWFWLPKNSFSVVCKVWNFFLFFFVICQTNIVLLLGLSEWLLGCYQGIVRALLNCLLAQVKKKKTHVIMIPRTEYVWCELFFLFSSSRKLFCCCQGSLGGY